MNTILLIHWAKGFLVNLVALFFLLLLAIPFVSCAADPIYTATDEIAEVQMVDTSGEIIGIDSATGVISTIESDHHKIHDGSMFTVIETVDLGNGETRDILMVSPDTTKWAHLVWEIEHELETSVSFYKDTTYSDNGTPITSFNRNGNSTANATTLIYHTANITNVGTLVANIQQGSGKKAGGADRQSNEFILKQNCAYLVRITNETVHDNLIFLKLNWYEHTNKG